MSERFEIENDAYLLRFSCYIHRNPLRAGFAERLVNYKWSSYQFYAYKKKPPEWLKTGEIFSQINAVKDKQRAYRNRVQGTCSNQKIGELFNITYSSVSRRISHIKSQLKTSDDCTVKKIYKKLNAIIKV